MQHPGMEHPYTRYVALGDSFTEGIGDEEPDLPNGVRGWADRVAEELAASRPDFQYANLAIRGRLLGQIEAEQLEPALALEPDLVTISAGGNDLIRPGGDPDALAARLDVIVGRLRAGGADVVLFNGPDVAMTPVLRSIRGKVGIYNSNLFGVAAKHGAIMADMWSARHLQQPQMWAPDRLHFSHYGHHAIAMLVLDALGVHHDLTAEEPEPLPARTWQQLRMQDLHWAREHLAPWVVRRLRGQSSGDTISPKRPEAGPVLPTHHHDLEG
ncbi:SGNH/GDSL hydrolase family protein [Agrococcus sp. ARC_14]|uniref:SGNH/GDSL hydrolase family protein n=1 Tax=Agrococcus sp. ARC_14 TaxID=2919927 RepID=UPI001F05AA5F|nr:SGNH/GDSL hydrolase family protein [Agrococcus sp. ARC_14]MCH1883184.1 SGNH/GDSL hydrolase family protein [Agrococcus sp. ARC_14]